MKRDIEKYKGYIEIFLKDYFGVDTRHNFRCINPQHQDKNPSMSFDKINQKAHCFGCGINYDIYDLIMLKFGLDDFNSAYEKAASIYGTNNKQSLKQQNCINKSVNYSAYIKKCHADVYKTKYYTDRGLSDNIIEKYHLGYDESSDYCYIIPVSNTYYFARHKDINEKRKTLNPKGGKVELLNADYLYQEDTVFIVEGWADALSIEEVGGKAISANGAGNAQLIIQHKDIKAKLILLGDNDAAGEMFNNNIAQNLNGVEYCIDKLPEEYHDCNDMLVKARSDFIKFFNKTRVFKTNKAEIAAPVANKSISAYELQKSKLEQPKWIVQDILPQGLAIISAPSKAGKSWMMLQLCLSVATGGDFLGYKTIKNDCWYLALEDSKLRLKDRMDKMLKVKDAPDNLYFSIDANSLDNGLLGQLENELKIHKKIGLIVIDTMQKIRGKVIKNEGMYSSDYREMAVLKQFADKHKIAILLVHHLRKMKDDDIFNCISGSNGLMGACDTVFVISRKKREDDEAELAMTGRDIRQGELIITFNKEKYIWEPIATPEQIKINKEKHDYENNVVVKTIKGLLKINQNRWSGNATDIIKASNGILGYKISETPTSIGKNIAGIEKMLYADGIQHEIKKGRRHLFSYIDKPDKLDDS